jgi:hypothetical protein
MLSNSLIGGNSRPLVGYRNSRWPMYMLYTKLDDEGTVFHCTRMSNDALAISYTVADQSCIHIHIYIKLLVESAA